MLGGGLCLGHKGKASRVHYRQCILHQVTDILAQRPSDANHAGTYPSNVKAMSKQYPSSNFQEISTRLHPNLRPP